MSDGTIDNSVNKYDNYEELDGLCKALHLKFNDAVCGYLRQPITYRANLGGIRLTGTCTLERCHCSRFTAPYEEWSVTECEKYQNLFMKKE